MDDAEYAGEVMLPEDFAQTGKQTDNVTQEVALASGQPEVEQAADPVDERETETVEQPVQEAELVTEATPVMPAPLPEKDE